VKAVFDHPVIQRCQRDQELARQTARCPGSIVEREMRAAYRNPDALAAQVVLGELAKRLDKSHRGAASSLREGLSERLTITRLGVPPTLAQTLRSTKPIESMIEICRDHSRNVKRCHDGTMALRCRAAGVLEAKKQFRRANGHLHIKALRQTLDDHLAASAAPPRYGSRKEVSEIR
jgi:hypothetical protein